MSEVRYAIACNDKGCGNIEDKAWTGETATEHSRRTERPLTSRDRVPLYCTRCGQKWWKQATKEQVEAFDARSVRETRIASLLRHDDFDGLFKVPDEIRADATIKRALANLLGPLEGETLKAAQHNVRKVAQSGRAGDSSAWIEWYDQAVAKAVANTKQTAGAK